MMLDSFIFIVFIHLIAGILVPAIILIKKGYRLGKDGKRNLKLIKAGWIMIGSLSIALTILFAFIFYSFGGVFLPILIFVFPILIIVGSIISLTYGIIFINEGLGKDENKNRDKSKITGGAILISISASIVLVIVILLLAFFNGIIVINLM